jgi:adenylate cyclase
VSSAGRYGLDPGILLRAFEARVLWWLGYPDRCLAVTEDSLILGHALAHAPTLGFVLALAATMRQCRGDVDQVETLAQELKTQGSEHGLQLWVAEGSFFEGWVRFQRHPESLAGIEHMRTSLVAYRATGTQLFLPHGYATLAEAFRISDRAPEGLQMLQEARELPCFKLPYPIFYTAELLRVESELLMAMGNQELAEERLIQGLSAARQQKIRSCELRLAVTLCKLRKAQNRKSEALEVLTPVFEWFTEGFDTPDLKEARAELES